MRKKSINLIRTTAYVKRSIRKKFEAASIETGLSLSELFVKLIIFCINHKRKYVSASPWTSVYYQEADVDADWSRLKVKLLGKEYEYMADIRKIFRVSVSAFFALAVEDHLDELVDIITGKSKSNQDNYLNTGYIFSYQELKTSVKWTFYWGIPHDMTKSSLNQIN